MQTIASREVQPSHRGDAVRAEREGLFTGGSMPSVQATRTTDILIVDDDVHIAALLRDFFEDLSYVCQTAANGQDGLRAAHAEHPRLVIADVRMPVMDGVELLRRLREGDPDVAVIMLTGLGDMKTAVESLKLGAYDFITKPVNLDELQIAAQRALEHRQLLRERREHQTLLEQRVQEATRELAATLTELEDTYRATLHALGSALDTRDAGTEAHSRRVHGYSLLIARAHGVPPSRLRELELGVLLHDIGKIAIPDAILLKPGPLTPDEWKVMRTHPEVGKRLVERIPFLRGAVPIVYHHHERWDGAGYPLGLAGEDIPLGARIFAVADAFDAMTFDRPYSRGIPAESAREEIARCAGTQFDPGVVESFLSIRVELLDEIRRANPDEPVDVLVSAVER